LSAIHTQAGEDVPVALQKKRARQRGANGPKAVESKASPETLRRKSKLLDLFARRTMSDDDLIANAGLYMRSSGLAKILFVNELYELILNVPGIIVELGVWYGQNISLFENLRAIYEPFNQNRRIVGFDTFEGYASLTSREKTSPVIAGNGYKLPSGYADYLREVVAYHESNNIMGHIRKHEIVAGDVVKTVPKFFADHPGDIVALAYFDLATYKPTKAALEALLPHTVPGSVLLMDELNFREYDGASIAFKEVFAGRSYKIRKSRYMTDRSIIIL
jgi:hypothetical protein